MFRYADNSGIQTTGNLTIDRKPFLKEMKLSFIASQTYLIIRTVLNSMHIKTLHVYFALKVI